MAANRKAPFRRLYWFQSAKIFAARNLTNALAPVNRPNGDSLFAAMGRSNNFPGVCADHELSQR